MKTAIAATRVSPQRVNNPVPPKPREGHHLLTYQHSQKPQSTVTVTKNEIPTMTPNDVAGIAQVLSVILHPHRFCLTAKESLPDIYPTKINKEYTISHGKSWIPANQMVSFCAQID